jgi:hypothetical protein
VAWLVAGDLRYPPERVPPGHYRITGRFDGRESDGAGDVSVRAGETVRVACNAQFARCVPQELP